MTAIRSHLNSHTYFLTSFPAPSPSPLPFPALFPADPPGYRAMCVRYYFDHITVQFKNLSWFPMKRLYNVQSLAQNSDLMFTCLFLWALRAEFISSWPLIPMYTVNIPKIMKMKTSFDSQIWNMEKKSSWWTGGATLRRQGNESGDLRGPSSGL